MPCAAPAARWIGRRGDASNVRDRCVARHGEPVRARDRRLQSGWAAAVPAVDALLTRLSARHDVGYLSMLDADLPYLDDDLHLTPEGHREFGDRVAAALSADAAAG